MICKHVLLPVKLVICYVSQCFRCPVFGLWRSGKIPDLWRFVLHDASWAEKGNSQRRQAFLPRNNLKNCLQKRKSWTKRPQALNFHARLLNQLFASEQRFLARPASGFGRSLDEWVGEEEHQGNHQAINRQGLHECQGQQQHTSQIICHLRLARDAINASAGSNALANTRTNCSQANGEASANGGQSRDPHGALISKCCLWCHQGGRGQSCCGSSACRRSRHMGAARGRHEGGQECTAAQQHGTSQDEGASHFEQSKIDTTGNRSWHWRTWAHPGIAVPMVGSDSASVFHVNTAKILRHPRFFCWGSMDRSDAALVQWVILWSCPCWESHVSRSIFCQLSDRR